MDATERQGPTEGNTTTNNNNAPVVDAMRKDDSRTMHSRREKRTKTCAGTNLVGGQERAVEVQVLALHEVQVVFVLWAKVQLQHGRDPLDSLQVNLSLGASDPPQALKDVQHNWQYTPIQEHWPVEDEHAEEQDEEVVREPEDLVLGVLHTDHVHTKWKRKREESPAERKHGHTHVRAQALSTTTGWSQHTPAWNEGAGLSSTQQHGGRTCGTQRYI
jgi:hypothetical protein